MQGFVSGDRREEVRKLGIADRIDLTDVRAGGAVLEHGRKSDDILFRLQRSELEVGDIVRVGPRLDRFRARLHDQFRKKFRCAS